MTDRRRLKMWMGNLDGDRMGLVIATSKVSAMMILHLGRTTFDNYWVQQPDVLSNLEPNELYTRPIIHVGGGDPVPWQKGLCNLAPAKRAGGSL